MLMAHGVVLLDMLELRGIPKGGIAPVEVPQPAVQRRVSGADVAYVAFEVLYVDDIEADDGGVEADVGFGEAGAKVVGALGADGR